MKKIVKVGNDKIKIEVSRMGTVSLPTGCMVRINDKIYYYVTENLQEASDNGFVKYLKENR